MQRSDIVISLCRDSTKSGYYVCRPSDVKKIFRLGRLDVVTQARRFSVVAKTEDEVWEALKDNPNISLVDDDPLMVDF